MELNAAIESFLQDARARALSPKTLQRYRADLEDLARFLKGQSVTALEGITPDILRQYFADLQERENGNHPGEKLSPFTIDGMYRSIKTFFRWCEWDESLSESPMRRVRHIRLPERIVPRLSDQQSAQLIEAVQRTKSPERNEAIVTLALKCGLRRGELLGLRVEDVHLDERRVRVVQGKGRRDRDVPIGQAATEALRAWLSIRPTTPYPQVFLNDDGTPFKASGLRSLLRRLQTRLKFDRLYAHLCRHTFAEQALRRVKDPKIVQQILGHKKVSTTLDIYCHHDFEYIQREMERTGAQ